MSRRRKSAGSEGFINLGKRPRHYAQEIAALQKRQERIDALELVPEEFRPIVKEHVITAFKFKNGK